MRPQGYLVSIGGFATDAPGTIARNKPEGSAFHTMLQLALKRLRKPSPIVEIVRSGNSHNTDSHRFMEAFRKSGCVAEFLDIFQRKDLEHPDILSRVNNCDVIVFCCEEPVKLSCVFGGTAFIQLLKQRYENERFMIVGSQAGAMAMSQAMIGFDFEPDEVNRFTVNAGFNLVRDVIIDPHYHKPGRFELLSTAVALQPGILAIGLGNQAGILIAHGSEIHSIGSGTITVIDGQEIRHDNMADIRKGVPLSVENLRVHILSSGNCYDLATRTYKTLQAEAVKP